MTDGSSPPWYEAMRTSLADPVLSRRLRLRSPQSSPDAVRGVVFDLVTGARSPNEALESLVRSPEERRQWVTAILKGPELEEVQAALREAGRAGEADSLDPGGLGGGEFEHRTPSSPLVSASVSTPAPTAGPEPAAPPDAEKEFRPLATLPDEALREQLMRLRSEVMELRSEVAILRAHNQPESVQRLILARLEHLSSLLWLLTASVMGAIVLATVFFLAK